MRTTSMAMRFFSYALLVSGTALAACGGEPISDSVAVPVITAGHIARLLPGEQFEVDLSKGTSHFYIKVNEGPVDLHRISIIGPNQERIPMEQLLRQTPVLRDTRQGHATPGISEDAICICGSGGDYCSCSPRQL